MEISYDASVDAMYIKLSEKTIQSTHTLNKDVNVDVDENGNVVGIELLYASTYTDDVLAILYRYTPRDSIPARQPPQTVGDVALPKRREPVKDRV